MNRRVPLVTILLCLLNLVGLIYEIEVGEDVVTSNYGMYQGALENGEWLRLVISGFLHFGVAHFGSNILCLIMFGIGFECDMGHVKYAVVYLFGLIGAGVFVNYVGGAHSIHAGASGAIWALMMSALVFTVRNHRDPINVLKGIAVNVIYSFSAGISWQGHIGGSVAGAIVAAIVFRDSFDTETRKTKRINKWVDNNGAILSGIVCNKCGQRLGETVLQCPVCGEKQYKSGSFSQNNAEDLKKSLDSKDGGWKALLIGIIVVLLGVLAVGLVITWP